MKIEAKFKFSCFKKLKIQKKNLAKPVKKILKSKKLIAIQPDCKNQNKNEKKAIKFDIQRERQSAI